MTCISSNKNFSYVKETIRSCQLVMLKKHHSEKKEPFNFHACQTDLPVPRLSTGKSFLPASIVINYNKMVYANQGMISYAS